MLKHNLQLKISLFILLWLFLFSSTLANPIKTEAENAYYAWCAAIGTAKGNANEVVKFYGSNAVLHPTLSSKILITHDELNNYFTKLTRYKNIKCTTDKLISRIHDNIVIISGLYTFSYADSHDHPKIIPARFSFVYKKFNNRWLIIDQHSSKMP